MKINYTMFGETRLVSVSKLHNMKEGDQHDEVLWVERDEDYYALLSPQLRDKKVVVITRHEWLNSEGSPQ